LDPNSKVRREARPRGKQRRREAKGSLQRLLRAVCGQQRHLRPIERLVASLYVHWRAKQPRPQHLTLTDFQSAMGEDNLAQAMTFVTHSRPKLA
jgi:hypothetical protein